MAKKLSKRAGNKIDITLSLDYIVIICQIMSELLAQGHSISIKNFGTLTTRTYPSRINRDVTNQKLRATRPFQTVVFRPNANFMKLVSLYKEKLLLPESKK